MTEEKINQILELIQNSPSVSFNGEKYLLPENSKVLVDKYNVPYDETANGLELNLKQFFSGISLKYFESLESEIRSKDVLSDFYVITKTGALIKYSFPGQSYLELGKKEPKSTETIKNHVSYLTLFNYLKSNNFCDYFNDANNEIIIYSSVNGIIKIKYDTIPTIPSGGNVPEKVQEIIKICSSIEVAPFFKNSIYTFSNGTGLMNLKDIIEHSKDLISITKRDYELVSKQFDFDRFRDSLYKEKEKYFTSIRELISKIFGQAVGIPISISASVFATYKVSDDVFMLLLVLLAFGLYAAFYLRIQFVFRADLKEIEQSFEKDFDVIKTKSGLAEEVINEERNKITAKISSTQMIIDWLIGLVSFLSLLVLFYVIYEIIYSESVSLIKSFFD